MGGMAPALPVIAGRARSHRYISGYGTGLAGVRGQARSYRYSVEPRVSALAATVLFKVLNQPSSYRDWAGL